MKIGVIGSGEVAKTLASGFLKHGHQVKVGTRTEGKLADWAAQNSEGSVGNFADTAAFGELVVLAVAGKAARVPARVDCHAQGAPKAGRGAATRYRDCTRWIAAADF